MTIAIRACCVCFRLLDPPWREWPGTEPAAITTSLCNLCNWTDGEQTLAEVLHYEHMQRTAEDREAAVDHRQRLEQIDRERTERRF
jgi:hypothetical protein